MAIARILLCLFALLIPATARPQVLPNPVLEFLGAAPYEANGQQWTRYRYAVVNRSKYPDALFAAAPDLPPCGTNANSSRAWVDVYEQRGKRLYGFCALGTSAGLGQLWFALPVGEVPPSWIYIEIDDRKTSHKYRSNLVETTL